MKTRQFKNVRLAPKTAEKGCCDGASDQDGKGCCPPSTTKQQSCCSPQPVITSCCPSPADKPSCCGPPVSLAGGGSIDENVPGFLGWLATPAGRVPLIATRLAFSDRLGGWKARWGIGRMNYIVPPGLYAIGSPTSEDPVLVTANYKMSYDIIREALTGRNAWVLVLETFGVNVWCAAGKGTFGTEELVQRIQLSRLGELVSHRRLILPILGAPGVAAHEVSKRTGFSVKYAAIRAAGIPRYLDNGMITTEPMRRITFSFMERFVLIPVELTEAIKPTAIVGLLLALILWLTAGSGAGISALTACFGAMFAGVVAVPLLLPWLPFRSFALKGAITGLAWCALFFATPLGSGWGILMKAAAVLSLPALSAFYALNFTGCTTFTSRSGVKKEMRLSLPVMGCAMLAGAVLMVAGIFI